MHIGDLLLENELITEEQLASALKYQKDIGGHLGHILVKLGHINEDRLIEVLSAQMQISTFDLSGFEPDPEVMGLLPREVLERLNMVPIRKDMGSLVVGVSDPADFAGMDELRMHAGGNIETVLVAPSKAIDTLNQFFLKQEREHGGGKAERKSPRSGRERLSSLVDELGRQASLGDGEWAGQGADSALDEHTTRDLVLGVIRALQIKGVLAPQDVLAATENAGRGAMPGTDERTAE